MKSLVGSCYFTKQFSPTNNMLKISWCNLKRSHAELHFAEVYRLVASVYNQIYLSTFTFFAISIHSRKCSPWANRSLHSIYTQSPFDLPDMMKTHLLKSIATPSTMTWGVDSISPKSLVHTVRILDITKVEQWKQIGKLIYGFPLFFVKWGVATNEVAIA